MGGLFMGGLARREPLAINFPSSLGGHSIERDTDLKFHYHIAELHFIQPNYE
jgi:hypothetical protein